MSGKGAKVMTQVASHANTIADTYRAALAQHRLGEHTVDMTAPEESTQGGKLALQHVTLRAPSGMSLVVGVLNAIEKTAELRTYPYVLKVYFERFKKSAPFSEEDYRAFVERSETILSAFGIAIAHADPAEEPAPALATPSAAPAAGARAGGRAPLVLGIAVVVLLTVALGLFLALRAR